MPLMVLMALSLDVAPLMVTVCFLGVIDAMEEAFEEGFWDFKRKILSVETQISMKVPVCGEDFPSRAIRQLVHTTSESKKVECE